MVVEEMIISDTIKLPSTGNFTVKEIIGYDMILVSPPWNYNEYSGDKVKIIGYTANNTGSTTAHAVLVAFAKDRLAKLILNQKIDLVNVKGVAPDSSVIYCVVNLNGIDISEYFPDFKPKKSNIGFLHKLLNLFKF